MLLVAILLSAKEALEDLEQSEIRTMLLRLPLLNMEMVNTEIFEGLPRSNYKHLIV
jgi:hypothetical protein